MAPTRISALAFVLALAAGAAPAATLTYYPTRAAFDAANPGLKVQSFDAANLSGQAFVTQPNPLDAKTNNAVFAAGSILPGIVLRTRHPGSAATALLVYGGGPVGAVSVGNNWYGDTLVIALHPGVMAVAETAFGNTSSGTSFPGKITERFLSGTTTIGTRTFSEAAGGDVFIGASSPTDPITSVRITWGSDNDASVFVSDIEFGAAGR